MLELFLDDIHRAQAAIDRDRHVGEIALQGVDERIIERRHVAVFLRRQAFQPRLARVDDECIDAGALELFCHRPQSLARLLVIDADAAFDRDRNIDRRLHRHDRRRDQIGLTHQTGAECAILHAIGRTAAVEIDFVIAVVGADARALRQRLRLAAAKLQRDGMFGGIIAQQAIARTEEDRARRHHFCIEQRLTRQQPVQIATMAI